MNYKETLFQIITRIDKIYNRESIHFFTDNPRSVSIIAALEGLAPGSYSFSIHESGDISHDCSTVGEQFTVCSKF